MNSYARSEQESNADESNYRSQRQAQSEQAARGNEEEQNNEAAATAAEQQSAPQSAPAASSVTGGVAFAESGSPEEETAETAAGAGTTAESAGTSKANNGGTTPQTGATLQFSGASTLQLLLNGGSLAQILATVSSAPGNTLQPSTTQSLTGAQGEANGSAGSVAVKLAIAQSSTWGVMGAAALKSVKTKAEDLKRAADANSSASPGTLLLPADAFAGNGTALAAAGAAGSVAKEGLAIGSTTPEALHLSATGQSENAANVAAANNFAFAVRFTAPGAAAQHTEANDASTAGPLTLTSAAQPSILAAATEAAALAGGGAQTGEHAGETPDQGQNQAAMVLAPETAAAAQTATASSAAGAEAAAPAAASDPEAAGQAEPLRNVRLQLVGDNNQRVDIRLVEVGGEMRVSVRAGDSKLAQTLQEHIPDLSGRLNQQSVRAEIWSPRSENGSSANSSNGGGQPSRGGDAPGQGQQQRQGNGSQQQDQPDWVDELENYSGPSTTTTTRSNQLWPQ